MIKKKKSNRNIINELRKQNEYTTKKPLRKWK